MNELHGLIEQIKARPGFAVYGAQTVAYGVYRALRELYSIAPECFIVSNAEENPQDIEGIPVCALGSYGHASDVLILVAVTELLQDEICGTLSSEGFDNYIRINAHTEHMLMSAYYSSIGRFPLLSMPADATESTRKAAPAEDFNIYIVTHHTNKPLGQTPMKYPWNTEIQAGAAQAGEHLGQLAGLADNTGDNISRKNPQYAEATAIYWVWKNTSHAWKGIGHYRRQFVLSDAHVAAITAGGADALLPLPYICYPDVLTQFGRFVSNDVANTLLESLSALYPERYDFYRNILSGQYFYPYNLFAARCGVFDECCAWMFPVLEHMEHQAADVPELNSTRALAYASELLTSLFFLSNEDRFNVRHAEKAIYI